MSADVGSVVLRAEHAIELGELLEFLGGLVDHAPDLVADALSSFCGAGYMVEDLSADVARFAFLLGGDGEQFVSGGDW